jgi:glycosyltransferase involved in cell wall biosynthesis
MRVLLVGEYPPDAQQSMQRYGTWLKHTLEAHGNHVTLIKPKVIFSRLAKHPALSKYLGYIDKYLLFLPTLRGTAKRHELVHVLDHSNSMYLTAVHDVPKLITCHDLLAVRSAHGDFVAQRLRWPGKLLQRWILSGMRKARYVVCVSEKTAADLKSLTGDTGARVRVIHNALNWNYGPGAALSESLLSRLGLRREEPYLLHVGGNQWYKNRIGAVQIFARLASMQKFSNVRLVMAGKPWPNSLRTAVIDEGLGFRVIEALGINNEELQALYSNAVALLFPSLEEGFGWPVLEAQACGCPVITTDRAPMTEVAGGAAILIDPSDPARAAASIAEALEQRETLRKAGFRNLQRFDHQSVTQQYLAVYDEVLGAARSSSH